MTQKTIYVLIIVACLAVVLSGCVEKKVTVDAYYCEVDDGILYLMSDNTYELLLDESVGGGGWCGNYTNREGKTLLKTSFIGSIIVFVQDSHDLIDPDGDSWVLQK